MGQLLNVGSFQVALAAELVAQRVQPPSSEVTAGAEQMASAVIRAMKGNTGIIYIGDADVAAANGFELAAGDALTVDIAGLGNVWFNGTKTGDKLCVFFASP